MLYTCPYFIGAKYRHMVRLHSNVSALELQALANGLRQSTERNVWLKWSLADPFPLLSNCLPAAPAASNTQNRHQLNVLLFTGPRCNKGGNGATEIFQISYTGALWFFEQRKCNICSGACGLPELGSDCYIALAEQRKTQPRVFVISEVWGAILQANIRARRRDRCLDICCQTKSDTVPRRQEKKKAQTLLATICQLQCRSEKS